LPCTREGRNPGRAVDAVDEFFDLEGLALDLVEVVAVNLHADLRADAGVEHEDAVLDGLQNAGT
jgi:hypothetical protein